MRTRMAPSPTGEFHIGSMRTLLYSYALGKKDGQFILRIEDTDQKREVEGTRQRIKDVIRAYGFDWDEEYTQSERLPIYQEHAKKLIDAGHAYYCFCTPERLEEVRAQQQKEHKPPRYDRHCRNLSPETVEENKKNKVPYVIRMKIPDDEIIKYVDAIHGEILFPSNEIDDQVLQKADGFPTYHHAVVVDDHLMEITHILRGHEWLPSAPKHVLLYRYYGWEMPVHAHLPNLKDKGSTKKMSKRLGDVHAAAFLEKGYLPEAMVNFLMLLGWNPGNNQELFTLEEFIKVFDLKKVHKTDLIVFDREKLLWMNGQYIRQLSTEALLERIEEWANKYGVTLVSEKVDREKVLGVLNLVHERMKLFSEYNDLVSYFYAKPEVDRELLQSFAGEDKAKEILNRFVDILKTVENWNKANLEDVCNKFITDNAYTPKEAFMTMRVSLTGRSQSPHIFDVLEVLGKEESINRLGMFS